MYVEPAMNDPEYRVIDVSNLRVEDGVQELLNSPDMQPYSRYIEGAMTGADIGPSVQEIAELPWKKDMSGGLRRQESRIRQRSGYE
jgi:hypothetical protein